MALIVQKFGGSSLASVKKIKKLAEKVYNSHLQGNQLVVVVSAMGKTTNELSEKAHQLTASPGGRELDMLLSVGERISISLMTLAINDFKADLAQSFTGSQIGLITDCNHGNARILEIKGDRLKTALSEGKIPVIAGYQGVSTNKEITTLGRGGTDTTAVAVAAAIKADRCEIYSDVDGVYTADPHLVKDSLRHQKISYETMLEMSRLGAKVLKDEAVEYAKRLNIKIAAGKSSNGYIGTIVTSGELSNNSLSGIVSFDNLAYLEISAKLWQNQQELFLKIPEHRFYQKNIILKKEILIYESKYQINDNDLKKLSKPCSSIAIVGTGLKSHLTKIKKMQQSVFTEYTETSILAEQFSSLSYEIFLKERISDSLVKKLHKVFFGS